MYKTFLLGTLAVLALGTVMVLAIHAFDPRGEIVGVIFVLGSGAAGLIGGEVARRTEKPNRRPPQP